MAKVGGRPTATVVPNFILPLRTVTEMSVVKTGCEEDNLTSGSQPSSVMERTTTLCEPPAQPGGINVRTKERGSEMSGKWKRMRKKEEKAYERKERERERMEEDEWVQAGAEGWVRQLLEWREESERTALKEGGCYVSEGGVVVVRVCEKGLVCAFLHEEGNRRRNVRGCVIVWGVRVTDHAKFWMPLRDGEEMVDTLALRMDGLAALGHKMRKVIMLDNIRLDCSSGNNLNRKD